MSDNNQFNDDIEQAYQEALKVRQNAHAPYSNFKVGSSLKMKNSPTRYLGCNVENASYGGTICAERNSILQAIANNGEDKIEYIVVVADTVRPTVPCAFCLQVMSEFTKEDFPIYMGNSKSLLKKYMFRELLPISFDTLDDQ